ncbi:MAG: flavodoxin domain-containing protein [Chitinispirillaceae bacterium]
MSKKILVAYASTAGSTAEVAQSIAQTISEEEGYTAEAVNVKKVRDISDYDGIVLGSAIRMGRPLSEMNSFVKRNQQILASKKVALFAVCLALMEDTPEKRKEASVYLDSLKTMVTPVAEEVFAGKMDSGKLGFFGKMMIRMVKSPEGDYRNWEKIGAWAKEVKGNL